MSAATPIVYITPEQEERATVLARYDQLLRKQPQFRGQAADAINFISPLVSVMRLPLLKKCVNDLIKTLDPQGPLFETSKKRPRAQVDDLEELSAEDKQALNAEVTYLDASETDDPEQLIAPCLYAFIIGTYLRPQDLKTHGVPKLTLKYLADTKSIRDASAVMARIERVAPRVKGSTLRANADLFLLGGLLEHAKYVIELHNSRKNVAKLETWSTFATRITGFSRSHVYSILKVSADLGAFMVRLSRCAIPFSLLVKRSKCLAGVLNNSSPEILAFWSATQDDERLPPELPAEDVGGVAALMGGAVLDGEESEMEDEDYEE